LIQEQNSYPGIANKILSHRAKTICTAYQGMEQWFNKRKIVFTGNPIRESIVNINKVSKEKALMHFSLKEDLPTVLVIGGSLGAETFNTTMVDNFDYFKDNNIQLLLQTGSRFAHGIEKHAFIYKNVTLRSFISHMDLAYKAADIIISRSGALAISELCVVGKPIILVPSPNVAEDHQTKNAMALVEKNAAILVSDDAAPKKLIPTLDALIKNKAKCEELSQNILKLGVVDADEKIALEIKKLNS
jgi:UDP-N-acetylglucosamine--N-acetylmuramyl-(pentapeptide) pyrophosphoryl-undecaprenol N-acetylglucosamine transferase